MMTAQSMALLTLAAIAAGAPASAAHAMTRREVDAKNYTEVTLTLTLTLTHQTHPLLRSSLVQVEPLVDVCVQYPRGCLGCNQTATLIWAATPHWSHAWEQVTCTSTAGEFQIELYRSWSPLGYDRFVEMVDGQYFDGQALWRAVPRFVVQFGIPATPVRPENALGML